jgi:hypothetical protein
MSQRKEHPTMTQRSCKLIQPQKDRGVEKTIFKKKPRGKRDGEYGDEAMAARNANVILLNKKQQNSGAPSPSKHLTCPVLFLDGYKERS